MFHNVPKGDAIIIKYILHDWSDEDCMKLLRNCYEALPNNGKGRRELRKNLRLYARDLDFQSLRLFVVPILFGQSWNSINN
ncbi:hypothetical protein CMV_030352 [Castanea mollissima]|uniref:O-methyltransferase C-terminal domain-containing protein n=1 Tax=Castanea mollissima TaxID=60419 RepID=A0A8J4Q4I6_9ROSI|nr:hypothetical protein CMV_030352 [Castanea mollissima]